MFLDFFEFKVENKQQLFRENCFDNVVSESYQKNLFGPQNPPKIVNVFIGFYFLFFFSFCTFFKSCFVDI